MTDIRAAAEIIASARHSRTALKPLAAGMAPTTESEGYLVQDALHGLLASESKTAVELIDAEAKKHVLQRDDIDVLSASNKSLMPEGFEKQLSKDDLVNLLEFLTQRGKYLPLPLDKAATIITTRGMFYSEDSPLERLIFPDWGPKTGNWPCHARPGSPR